MTEFVPAAPLLPPLPPLPPLGNLAYRAQRFLLTDSKMSEILVVRDADERELVFKIACVRQRSRTYANRQAIYNSVTWLETVGQHPGIITLHPIQQSDQRQDTDTPVYVTHLTECPGKPEFIVLDYLSGGTLSDFVRKRPLPFKVTLWLANRLATTLAYLHDHACVHRDLKPENILFATPPRKTATLSALQPVLIDFGVAARTGESQFVGGSRLWMAPELQEAYEQKPLSVDPSWDIYALGLLCCYMLSGTRPRRKAYTYDDHVDYQRTAFACCAQNWAAQPISDPPVRAAFQTLLCAALAETPAARPTAASFAQQTTALLAALGSEVAALQPAAKSMGFAHKRHQDQRPSSQVEPLMDPPQPPTKPKVLWRNRLSQRMAIAIVIILSVLILSLFILPLFTPLPTLLHSGRADDQTIGRGDKVNTFATPADQLVPASHPVVAQAPTVANTRMQPVAARPSVAPTHSAVVAPPQIPPTLASPPTNIEHQLAPLQIRLLTPAAGDVGSEPRVTFVWESSGPQPTPTQCYELVFWDPQSSADKRSPVGAGPESRRVVNLRALAEGVDPLLRTLAQSSASIAWGVRVVACASPQTILQDVGDVRTFRYQP